MITEFGKQLRKLRIDKEITLRGMAEAMDISPSQLSSIETGKRKITDDFFSAVVDFFGLKGKEVDELKKMADVSQNEITLSLGGANNAQRDSAVCFARRLHDLTDDDLNKINEILQPHSLNR